MHLVTIFLGLFAIVNPFGAMPMFISLTANSERSWQKSQALRGSLTMLLILVVFYFAGTYILNFFGISLSGIRVAGGLIIIKAGYDLFNRESSEDIAVNLNSSGKDISFSPLAMPMLSGPGSIAFVIGLSAQSIEVSQYFFVVASILAVALITFVILSVSHFFVRVLGTTGMDRISRIAGFVTMAIGVQMVLAGVKAFF